MADFQINDHILAKECDSLAAEIFAECVAKLDEGETPEDYRDEMDDRAHETADGHEWVIYNYKALMLCAHCDVGNGEEFMSDVGFEWNDDSTIYSVATVLAYGEMRARITGEIQRLCEEWEEAREVAA